VTITLRDVVEEGFRIEEDKQLDDSIDSLFLGKP
jgi:hypothetical protein